MNARHYQNPFQIVRIISSTVCSGQTQLLLQTIRHYSSHFTEVYYVGLFPAAFVPLKPGCVSLSSGDVCPYTREAGRLKAL